MSGTTRPGCSAMFATHLPQLLSGRGRAFVCRVFRPASLDLFPSRGKTSTGRAFTAPTSPGVSGRSGGSSATCEIHRSWKLFTADHGLVSPQPLTQRHAPHIYTHRDAPAIPGLGRWLRNHSWWARYRWPFALLLRLLPRWHRRHGGGR